MSVLDRPIVAGTPWVDHDAPTITLPVTDEPTGRHARRDAPLAAPYPFASPYSFGSEASPVSIPVVPHPSHPFHPVMGPARARTAFAMPPAGLAAPMAPATSSSWQARFAEAVGPAALDQIPGPVRRHPNLAAAAVIGFVVLAVILIVSAATPSTIDVHGSLLHVDSSSPLRAGSSCRTGLLDAGTPVEITDSSGTALGSGTLDTGIAMIDSGSVYGSEGYATSCAFSFTVNDVPAGHSSYRIAINGVPNRLSFSEQELRDGPGLHNGS
jgi:hypothetical protein